MKQFLTDENGERTAVVLPIGEYEELLERLELLEDAEALREADEALGELRHGQDEVVPIQQALREIQEGKVGAD